MHDTALQQLAFSTAKLLLKRAEIIAVAESCTGGWLAKLFTDVPGSSVWFDGGFITYSNSAKQSMLAVKAETLTNYGAVSEQVVAEMALNALQKTQVDWTISVSGIAGPSGGSREKPVGTVWFGFATAANNNVFTIKQIFSGERDMVRRLAVAFALTTLNEKLSK